MDDVKREAVKIMLRHIKELLVALVIIAGALVIFVSVVFSMLVSIFYLKDIPVNPDISWFTIATAYSITGVTIIGAIAYWVSESYKAAKEKISKGR